MRNVITTLDEITTVWSLIDVFFRLKVTFRKTHTLHSLSSRPYCTAWGRAHTLHSLSSRPYCTACGRARTLHSLSSRIYCKTCGGPHTLHSLSSRPYCTACGRAPKQATTHTPAITLSTLPRLDMVWLLMGWQMPMYRSTVKAAMVNTEALVDVSAAKPRETQKTSPSTYGRGDHNIWTAIDNNPQDGQGSTQTVRSTLKLLIPYSFQQGKK